ncbi:MAG: aminomethyl-transferring glycine dehydrogenase subunit GcvPA [Spirochaetes bacterium]|nr:aminomethyl-transferring glycine dehydrogenase subunit GcvPA [Spirochaetota bacterium]
MDYTGITERELSEMLAAIGVKGIDDLFADIPESIRLKELLDLPAPLSDIEVEKLVAGMAGKNCIMNSFLGAGAYRHHVPAVVDQLSLRGEFFTAYTPYQPEVSQGTLTAIFEYQTMICRLTALDVANASLYDGATAMVEAVLMSLRSGDKNRVAVSDAVHPHYRDALRTYLWANGVELVEISSSGGTTPASAAFDDGTAALVVQSPNFFGCIEDVAALAEKARAAKAHIIQVIAEPLSLGLLKKPGEMGVDIACGEAQSFGNYPGFGGPMLGFMAAKPEFMRRMPGRLVGRTADEEGREAYVLTLQTREQHIRRERATSNICTNQGLCALRAVIYLSMLGNRIRDLAALNHRLAAWLKHRLEEKGFTGAFAAPYFNEFVVRLEGAKRICDRLRGDGIQVGLPLEEYYPVMKDCLLVCTTEMNTPEEIDRLIGVIEGVM